MLKLWVNFQNTFNFDMNIDNAVMIFVMHMTQWANHFTAARDKTTGGHIIRPHENKLLKKTIRIRKNILIDSFFIQGIFN